MTDPRPEPEDYQAAEQAGMSAEELEDIQAARAERLSPENRPENAEVDNTGRDFDATSGQFTDTPDDPDIGPFEGPE